jgi:probable addiction module antidote protein
MSENNEFLLKDLKSVEGLDDLEGVEGVSDFDSAKHLKTKEAIAAYLSFAAQSGDTEHFKSALKTAAHAAEMGNLAANAAITRKSAYTALKPGSRPQMQTILGLLDALGMTIQIVPKETLKNSHGTARM